MNRRARQDAPCPCGGAAYARCCGRFHQGPEALAAPSAETLMRSRYSAYALRLADYLLATWHVSTRPPSLDFADAPKWVGLTIVGGGRLQENPANATSAARADRAAADLARAGDVAASVESVESVDFVEFVARGKIGGRAGRLHERSRFMRQGGRWYYLDGEILE